MENVILTAENILCSLRQRRLNKKDNLVVVQLFEHVEKHESENKTQQHRILGEVLRILTSSTTNTQPDNNSVYGCVIWLTYLQEKQKLPYLNEFQFDNVFQWLLNEHECHKNNKDATSRILIALGSLFLLHPANGDKYFSIMLNLLLKYICRDDDLDLVIIALQCMDNIFSTLKDSKLSDEQNNLCAEAGQRLLQIYYGDSKVTSEHSHILLLILSSLQVLHKIVSLNTDFARIHVGELLGLSKAYFHFGIDQNKCLILRPQKMYMSQQALFDSADEIECTLNSETARNCGGKTPKTRKPRAVVKNSRSNDHKNVINRSPENRGGALIFEIKTSDSDVSDAENTSNRILYERNRKAKIRLASISLVGTVARLLERKVIFGYWHALFPNGTAESTDNLLYIGQHDPNLRCRSAALQVCAQLLYGSKGFLHQAEVNGKKCPTAFIPFSVSLGFTVIAIYKSLTTILSSESSLPVLTQTLKCLAVLVQATPFQQFEKGFVQNFVKDVKPLVYHRDAAIQVSALMVMEFLVALPDTTYDIAEAVGLPPEAAIKNKPKRNRAVDEETDVVDIEEFVESDEDIGDDCSIDISLKEDSSVTRNTDTSWLLLRVLYNLTKHDKVIATSVRIESLQVLTVLSSHFAIIKPHLLHVSLVLQHSLGDTLPDVRLYAARCVDACAYQINCYLVDNAINSLFDIKECHTFWQKMMDIVVDHIRRASEEVTTVRITLCDALSNMGVRMFEHTSHSKQMNLVSFLSGVSSDTTDDTLVRATAVRALAVFALYPSLRDDLVFIENTAELTLRLAKDTNLLVRVKSFWSLGNISEALIGKRTEESGLGSAGSSHLRQERISDDMLFRLIEAATNACNDNDKVRCNAVRTLGNLLRLITEDLFASKNNSNNKFNWQKVFQKAICKLTDCIRSSGNAKVKWNTCYAISNLLRNRIIFKVSDLSWQETLYSALCHVIVHHSNFKVRINATTAITNISERSHFGVYYEQFWSSVLKAVAQSYNLDNFHEYNHRDGLQEQLCLALAHILVIAANDDLPMLKKQLLPHVEIIRNTWQRVINRMVPENAAPLLSCPHVLLERARHNETLSVEQKNSIDFLTEIFTA